MEEKQLLFNSMKTILNEDASNDIFMELDILLLKNHTNLNSYYFTEGFIDEIINNQEKYVGLPITVDLEKLMSKDFFNLGHNYSPIIEKFYTEQIGSYISFEKKYDESGIAELHGKARISKRNTDLVEVLMDLYQSSIGLNFSVEVFASDYTINSDNELVIDASPNNYLMADALVSFPAEVDSKALKLVAELNESIRKQVMGGEQMDKKDILSELSHSDMRRQLNEQLNPNHDSDGWRIYDYWIVSVYNEYVIVSDENKSGVYYKFQYTVNDKDEVTLGDKSQVTIQFVAINNEGGKQNMDNVNIDVNELVKEKESLLLKNDELTKQVESLEAKVKEVETSLNEANETVVSLGKEKETLVSELDGLKQFKSEIVEKETTTKINSIIEDVKSELTEEELKVINEIAETKEVDKVQYKVNEIMAKKYKETIKLNNSRNDDNDYFPSVKDRDIQGEDDLSKFNM